MKKVIFLLLYFHTILSAANLQSCLDRAYILALDQNWSEVNASRTQDGSNFNFSVNGDFGCCCKGWIKSYIKDITLDITENRVNPATDILLKSLRNQFKSSDVKIRELVNLRYINSLYSFFTYDSNDSSLTSSVDGCGEPFKFKGVSGSGRWRREGLLLEMINTLHEWSAMNDTKSIKIQSRIIKDE